MRHFTALLCSFTWLVLAANAEAQSADGNRLLAQVLASLQRHATITAKLRYQVRLDEHTLVGSGNYWQQGTDRKPLTRWEMQTQVAEKTASFIQIFDGDHLWTDRRLPSGRRVHRLDVPRLQAQLRSIAQDVPDQGSIEQMLRSTDGLGGLSQLVADLLRQFDFGPPRPTQLNGLTVDALVGRWRANQLEQLWPDVSQLGNENSPDWPRQLPHHVLVLVGKNLFPYVIEQRRVEDAYLADTVVGLRPAPDPLLRYEIFEVQFAAAIDRSRFTFQGDVDWTDETTLVVERLRKSRASPATAVATEQNSESSQR